MELLNHEKDPFSIPCDGLLFFMLDQAKTQWLKPRYENTRHGGLFGLFERLG